MVAKFIKDDIQKITTPKEFGVDDGITWNGVTVKNVIFDDEDIEVQTGEGVAHIMPQPSLTGSTSDFPGIQENDPVAVNGENFVVRNWKKDGTGQITIFLDRNLPS